MKKILFLVLNTVSHRTPEENLGVYYLMEILKNNNYKCEFIDAWIENIDNSNLLKKINLDEFAAIGISSCACNLKEIEIFKKLINNKIPIFVGGYGGTFSSEELLKIGCDLVALGEGDKNIIDIARYYIKNDIEKEKIGGIAYLENNKMIYTKKMYTEIELNDLPIPSRKYLEYITQKKATVNIMTSKGCRGNCTFCSISSFYKKSSSRKWREMSIENIVKNLKYSYDKGARVFKFIDDSFIEHERDEKWCKNFYYAILESGMNDILFRISIRPDMVTRERIKYLKKAGLFAVSCGIENGSDSFLKRIRKPSSKSINTKALTILKENSIFVQAGYILFDKETSYEELVENLDFIKKNKEIVTKGIFTELYAAEGTEYTENLKLYTDCICKKDGNYKYSIDDKYSEIIYNCLKKWHKNRANIYDKAIDPISAPKALLLDEYSLFYNKYREIRERDIWFMEYIIKNVKKISEYEIYDRLNELILNEEEWCNKFSSDLDLIYKKCGLEYNAGFNRFI